MAYSVPAARDRSGYLSEDTIAALATPAGGAVAIIRLSGGRAFEITSRLMERHADPVAQKRKLLMDLYKRVIDGVVDLGFPLSIHLEAAYGASAPAFETFERVLEVVSLDERDRRAARERWKAYARRGYPIRRHEVAA